MSRLQWLKNLEWLPRCFAYISMIVLSWLGLSLSLSLSLFVSMNHIYNTHYNCFTTENPDRADKLHHHCEPIKTFKTLLPLTEIENHAVMQVLQNKKLACEKFDRNLVITPLKSLRSHRSPLPSIHHLVMSTIFVS